MEIWKTINEYPYYQVSNKGNVKSIERNVKSKNGSIRTVQERILKQRTNNNGYKRVILFNDCKTPKGLFVHRLVACIETSVVYPSASEIQRQLGYSKVYIRKCCNGKYDKAYGYHWEWA